MLKYRFKVQGSGPPLAAEMASLIEKETSALRRLIRELKSEYRIMNIECRMSNVEGRNSIDFY